MKRRLSLVIISIPCVPDKAVSFSCLLKFKEASQYSKCFLDFSAPEGYAYVESKELRRRTTTYRYLDISTGRWIGRSLARTM